MVCFCFKKFASDIKFQCKRWILSAMVVACHFSAWFVAHSGEELKPRFSIGCCHSERAFVFDEQSGKCHLISGKELVRVAFQAKHEEIRVDLVRDSEISLVIKKTENKGDVFS